MTTLTIILITFYIFVCIGFGINSVAHYMILSHHSTFKQVIVGILMILFSPILIPLRIGKLLYHASED